MRAFWITFLPRLKTIGCGISGTCSARSTRRSETVRCLTISPLRPASKKYIRYMNLFELTKELKSIPSVSGDEEAVGFFLRDHLESLGWTVELQEVSANQRNVIAWLNETPRIFLSTHMDTVPPFIAPIEDEEKIYGRGACDAKGIIAAQIAAAEELRKEGMTDIRLIL